MKNNHMNPLEKKLNRFDNYVFQSLNQSEIIELKESGYEIFFDDEFKNYVVNKNDGSFHQIIEPEDLIWNILKYRERYIKK